MNESYWSDLLEQILNILLLYYATLGYLANYLWACKELDLISSNKEIFKFWNPIAVISGLASIINGILIIILLNIRINRVSIPNQFEHKTLIYTLLIPSFLVTVIFVAIKIILSIKSYTVFHDFTMVLSFGEMALFCSGIGLMRLTISPRNLPVNCYVQNLISFIKKLTLIGFCNSLIHYMTAQQIDNFINVASNFSFYKKLYEKSLNNRTVDYFNLSNISSYMVPIVIMFCCLCVICLSFNLQNYKSEITTTSENQNPSQVMADVNSSTSLLANEPIINRVRSLNMSPLLLNLGLIFLAISILATVIINSFLNSTQYNNTGRLISTIFAIPFYILAIILLAIQINEMMEWKTISTNEFTVDKMMLWIGAGGQLIICFAKLFMEFIEPTERFSAVIIAKYGILLFQISFQTVALNLAFKRKWMRPKLESWQEKLFPPIGLLSLNMGFLFISMLNDFNSKSSHSTVKYFDNRLFLRIFGNGFQLPGLILAIFHRLHSSVIFGKMIVNAN